MFFRIWSIFIYTFFQRMFLLSFSLFLFRQGKINIFIVIFVKNNLTFSRFLILNPSASPSCALSSTPKYPAGHCCGLDVDISPKKLMKLTREMRTTSTILQGKIYLILLVIGDEILNFSSGSQPSLLFSLMS